ncbi:MAG: glycosyltransferase family 2 protein [Hyphomicrobiaceae bacterium]
MIPPAAPAITSRTPTVSVVMAAYNAQAYLAEALESVLGQTLRDFELLVVDDASTDGTPALIERYASRDHRIRVFRLPRNAGTAHAKNVALQHARAPYVAICDDDDRQLPERLTSQVAYLEANPQHVMVGCQVRPFGDVDDAAPIAWLRGDDTLARAHVLFQALYIDSANLFRRELARAHGLAYPAGLLWDDWVFQALALQFGAIHVLPDVLLDYRRHAAQQTSPQRLLASGSRTRATLQRVLDVAGVVCSRAELELHYAISPSPFGLLPERDYLLRHGDSLAAKAGAWTERLGRQAVQSGWTDAAAFAAMAAPILRQLPQLLAAAEAGLQALPG